MTTPRILIVQARDDGDPMATHERECMARRIGGDADVTFRNAVVDDASPAWLDGHDAVIVGGSGAYSVHHPDSQRWVTPLRRLLASALDQELPGFGVCFGHQLLGFHLGAPVHTDETRAEVGTVDLELTETGKTDPLFARLEPTFHAHTGHSDHVAEVRPELELLATSATVETQAFRLRGTRFYTTQFHPDLTGAEAVARYSAFAQGRPELLPNVARFKPGADGSVTLISAFVSQLTQ